MEIPPKLPPPPPSSPTMGDDVSSYEDMGAASTVLPPTPLSRSPSFGSRLRNALSRLPDPSPSPVPPSASSSSALSLTAAITRLLDGRPDLNPFSSIYAPSTTPPPPPARPGSVAAAARSRHTRSLTGPATVFASTATVVTTTTTSSSSTAAADGLWWGPHCPAPAVPVAPPSPPLLPLASSTSSAPTPARDRDAEFASLVSHAKQCAQDAKDARAAAAASELLAETTRKSCEVEVEEVLRAVGVWAASVRAAEWEARDRERRVRLAALALAEARRGLEAEARAAAVAATAAAAAAHLPPLEVNEEDEEGGDPTCDALLAPSSSWASCPDRATLLAVSLARLRDRNTHLRAQLAHRDALIARLTRGGGKVAQGGQEEAAPPRAPPRVLLSAQPLAKLRGRALRAHNRSVARLAAEEAGREEQIALAAAAPPAAAAAAPPNPVTGRSRRHHRPRPRRPSRAASPASSRSTAGGASVLSHRLSDDFGSSSGGGGGGDDDTVDRGGRSCDGTTASPAASTGGDADTGGLLDVMSIPASGTVVTGAGPPNAAGASTRTSLCGFDVIHTPSEGARVAEAGVQAAAPTTAAWSQTTDSGWGCANTSPPPPLLASVSLLGSRGSSTTMSPLHLGVPRGGCSSSYSPPFAFPFGGRGKAVAAGLVLAREVETGTTGTGTGTGTGALSSSMSSASSVLMTAGSGGLTGMHARVLRGVVKDESEKEERRKGGKGGSGECGRDEMGGGWGRRTDE
jgi:hypothetical protein